MKLNKTDQCLGITIGQIKKEYKENGRDWCHLCEEDFNNNIENYYHNGNICKDCSSRINLVTCKKLTHEESMHYLYKKRTGKVNVNLLEKALESSHERYNDLISINEDLRYRLKLSREEE